MKERKEKPFTDINWSLFNYNVLLHPILALKDLRIKRMRKKFLIKHGYAEIGRWETAEYLRNILIDILTNYRDNGMGYPTLLPEPSDSKTMTDEERAKYLDDCYQFWRGELGKMIDLLKEMDDMNKEGKDVTDKKDEFFVLFSKYFYHLWD